MLIKVIERITGGGAFGRGELETVREKTVPTTKHNTHVHVSMLIMFICSYCIIELHVEAVRVV